MRHEISNSNAGFLTPRVQRGVNTKDSVGRTALHHAAHQRQEEVAAYYEPNYKSLQHNHHMAEFGATLSALFQLG